jgi:hypothetical protein
MANYALTTGNDTIIGTPADDIVTATAAALNPGDSLTGNDGFDTLELFGNGTFRIDQLASFVSFEIVTVTVGASGQFHFGNAPVQVNANSAGFGTYFLGSGATAFLANGSTFNIRSQSAAQWNAGNVINATEGSFVDLQLNLSNAANAFYDLTSNTFNNIDSLTAFGTNVTLRINNAIAKEVASFSGDASSRMTTSDAALDFSMAQLIGFAVVSTNTDGTVFTVGGDNVAFRMFGGTGTDTVVATGVTFSAADRNTIFGHSIEIIQDSTGTYVKPFGGPGDDDLTAPTGTASFDAGAGIDTVRFGFRLTDSTVSYAGNQVIIDGPVTHITLTGFERFVFTDGTVDNNDGNRLVDDLFYNSRNHDVWNARVDADGHYAASGRHENRDPNAFFDLSLYLAVNPDVQAAGVDPLTHFDQSGWKEGRVPSIGFGPREYLAANPDVAAAGVDPLWHYLQFGYQEGRQPIAPTSLIDLNGFDYVYYLQHNPDVAASSWDPLRHFQTVGWIEGRNPNALFDVNGYLSTYPDVNAAGVNPLTHYHLFGWKEGRDPSVNFDTTSYLAAYPDVAAAQIDPLVHFLRFGMQEGRQAFADGVWG